MKQVFLRHKNGGGRKFGNECEVSDDTFLDRRSSVGDRAEVFNASIHNSIVCDDTRVHGYPNPVSITDSALTGNTRVWQAPTISDCSLSNVSVFGTAVVAGVTLDGFVRLHAGLWVSAPRFERLSAPGLEVTISECVPGYGHIGCWCKPYETWFRPGYRQRIGKVSGWTPAMVEFTYERFRVWEMSPRG
jgi:hypothetical protein